MMSTRIRIGPQRLFSWFGAFVFMATLPLGCSPEEAKAQLAATTQEVAAVAAPRATLEEVAGEFICDHPSCNKESLHECTSCEYAVKYRNEIAAQLKQGHDKEQILNHFAETYGEHLLGAPRSPAAVGVPLLVVLLGLVPLAFVLRSKPHRTLAPQSDLIATKQTPNEDPRVAAALRDYDF